MTPIRPRKDPIEPRKRPSQGRSRATVSAILQGAAQVFKASGYADTTTDMVAERAGVSIGTLYQYYPNKDALLVALFEVHLEEIRIHFAEVSRALKDHSPLDELVANFVGRLFAMHAAAPRLHRIFVEEAPLPTRLISTYSELESDLRRAWVSYLYETRTRPTRADAELSALLMLQVLEAMAHRCPLYPPDGHTPEEMEAETVALIKAYLLR